MENKQQQCSTQFVLTIVYLNNILFHAEFSAMDYTLNIKKKRQYSNIRGLREGPGKFFMGVLEKSWIFLSVTVGTLDQRHQVKFLAFASIADDWCAARRGVDVH